MYLFSDYVSFHFFFSIAPNSPQPASLRLFSTAIPNCRQLSFFLSLARFVCYLWRIVVAFVIYMLCLYYYYRLLLLTAWPVFLNNDFTNSCKQRGICCCCCTSCVSLLKQRILLQSMFEYHCNRIESSRSNLNIGRANANKMFVK